MWDLGGGAVLVAMIRAQARSGVRSRWLAVPVMLSLLISCTSGGSGGEDENPLSGILLGMDDLQHRSVDAEAIPELPDTAPAYTVTLPTGEDLERLAEAYAGGPVIPGWRPHQEGQYPSFSTGDGWFGLTQGGQSDNSYIVNDLSWSWLQRDWLIEARLRGGPEIECPPSDAVDEIVIDFFAVLGMDVVPDGIRSCATEATRISLDILLDGLPVVGVDVGAVVDRNGAVVSASAPLLVVRPLADVALAPADEIRQRFIQGPGFLSGYFPCRDCTWSAEEDRPLGLALTVDGGLGLHDHTPGGVVAGEPGVFLVPALHVSTDFSRRGRVEIVSRGILAVSSAELVADPAEAEAARLADENAAAGNAECVTDDYDFDLGLCASRLSTTVDIPVLLTIKGEVYVPVGAEDCDPVLSLDLGDGTETRAFTPRSGTLVTARVAHTYREPGTYTVTAYSASQCREPGSGGAGEETEYEFGQVLDITVTGD